jgi:predicted permease
MLRRGPVFTVFAVASLALGLGAAGAIFSLYDAIVWRELPVRDPGRLVVVSFGAPGRSFNYSLPYPQVAAIRERSTTIEGVFLVNPFGKVSVTARGEADVVEGLYVGGDYYRTLDLAPAAGRLLTADDDRPTTAVAVISHAYWRRRFGMRPDVAGMAVRLNGVPFTIVGVEPAGFAGAEVGRPTDIAVPLRARDLLSEGPPLWNHAFATWVYAMGRLRPGATIEQAEHEANVIFQQVALAGAADDNQRRMAQTARVRLESGARGLASDLRRTHQGGLQLLVVLLGAVLLLASLNLATLMLSRSAARRREIATRFALGATRVRVMRQLLTESLLLAGLAAAMSVLVSWWGSRALLALATPAAEVAPVDVGPDARILAFTAAAATCTSVLFGLLPALRATRTGRDAAARVVGPGRRERSIDRALVAAQIALSLALLVVAGLFVRSVERLWAQDPGYDRNGVLLFSVDAHLAGKNGDDIPRTYQQLLETLRSVPSVRSASVSAVRPVSDTYYFVDGISAVAGRRRREGDAIRVAYNVVSPGYFATLAIPIVDGRDFDERDALPSPPVAIISERTARFFNGNPVGQTIALGGGAARAVVGVVKDTRYARVGDAHRDIVYLPLFQAPARSMWYSPTYVVRHAGPVEDLLPHVRSALAQAAPGLAPMRVRTLEAQTADSLSRERLLATIATSFGTFAALLSCIGLYGLMSYGVSRRTAELGVRMALGAGPGSVRWLVVKEAAATSLAGVVLGTSAALPLANAVRPMLFGVEPYDLPTLATAAAALLFVALAATWMPAHRASRIDPTTALRCE